MKSFFKLVIVIFVIGILGCTTNQRLMPTGQRPVVIPIYATQQTLFADAATEAVKDMSFPLLKGKTVYMEVVGCLPESQLYDYIVDTVSSKIAESDGIVIPVKYEKTKVYTEQGVEFVPKTVIPDTDYRAVVAIEASGADKIKKGINFWPFVWPKIYYEGHIRLRVTAYPLRNGLLSVVKRGDGKVTRLVSGKPRSDEHFVDPFIGFQQKPE